MTRLTPHRTACLGAGLGLFLALLLFAPARWLADALRSATAGQIQLINPTGTIWQGRANLLITGGPNSQSRTSLPQGMSWQLRPALAQGLPALKLRLFAPCCTPKPISLLLRPQWGGTELDIMAFRSAWPTELLAGMGTPWNTLRIQGQLALQTQGFRLSWAKERLTMQGSLVLQAEHISSRLSTLRPLGSYQIKVQAEPRGHTASLQLQTLQGHLQLQGSGQWSQAGLRFSGQAQASPGHEAALTNLLNIMGRRQGPLSVFTIG